MSLPSSSTRPQTLQEAFWWVVEARGRSPFKGGAVAERIDPGRLLDNQPEIATSASDTMCTAQVSAPVEKWSYLKWALKHYTMSIDAKFQSDCKTANPRNLQSFDVF
jgi:hypothetical protein